MQSVDWKSVKQNKNLDQFFTKQEKVPNSVEEEKTD